MRRAKEEDGFTAKEIHVRVMKGEGIMSDYKEAIGFHSFATACTCNATETIPHHHDSECCALRLWYAYDNLQSRLTATTEKLRRAEEVIRFYAEPEGWEFTTHESTLDGRSCADFDTIKFGPGYIKQVAGKMARAYFQSREKEG